MSPVSSKIVNASISPIPGTDFRWMKSGRAQTSIGLKHLLKNDDNMLSLFSGLVFRVVVKSGTENLPILKIKYRPPVFLEINETLNMCKDRFGDHASQISLINSYTRLVMWDLKIHTNFAKLPPIFQICFIDPYFLVNVKMRIIAVRSHVVSWKNTWSWFLFLFIIFLICVKSAGAHWRSCSLQTMINCQRVRFYNWSVASSHFYPAFTFYI